MLIYVHMLNDIIQIEAGEGNQNLLWLSHASISLYVALKKGSVELSDLNAIGNPVSINMQEGDELDFKAIIKDTLEHEMHVWLVVDIIANARVQE
ncbi:hypothetical protein PCE1_001780 [Barthelona sp. PCE]